jgi:hypothetical protein
MLGWASQRPVALLFALSRRRGDSPSATQPPVLRKVFDTADVTSPKAKKMIDLNCPEKDSLRDSHAIEGTEKQSQKGQASTSANSCKWDSTAPASAQRHAPAARIPHCERGRAADGDRAQTRAIWAPRRDDDPHCVPARTPAVGGVHVAVGHGRFGAGSCMCDE